MFWSPALTTFSVCAPAWPAKAPAKAIAAPSSSMRNFMTFSSVTTWLIRGEKQQRVAWNDDARRSPFRDALGRVDPDIGIGGAHTVSKALSDVHRLRHDSVQNQVSRCGFAGGVRRGEPRRVASKMDPDALICRRVEPERRERAVSAARDIDRVVGAHESGDKGRRGMVKNLL